MRRNIDLKTDLIARLKGPTLRFEKRLLRFSGRINRLSLRLIERLSSRYKISKIKSEKLKVKCLLIIEYVVVASCMVSLPINSCFAKDFGVHGHIFEVCEPSLLTMITDKLKNLKGSGVLADHQRQFIEKAKQRMLRPQPISGIIPTQVPRSWTYNPTFQVSDFVKDDLKDHQGRIFHRKGERINPLHYRPMTKHLVFFNGDDADQIAWVEQHYLKTNIPAKLILVSGAPFEWMNRWDREVYFDQGGFLTTKFNIKHVPAFVRQEQNYLRIDEVVCPAQVSAR